MLGEGLIKGLFGEKGLAGNVVEVLKSTGVLADPEQELKVKQALMDYEAKVGQQDVDRERIYADDRASARSREVEVAKTGSQDWTPKLLAYIAVLGFFGVLYRLFGPSMPEGLPRDAFLVLLGTLTKIVSDLYNYYFGSSAGSAQKTVMIDRLTK